MTFIITAVCLHPVFEPNLDVAPLLVRPVRDDDGAWARAGYLPGLRRYFPEEDIVGKAYYVLTDEGGGYESSNVFFAYSDDEDVPCTLRIAESHRGRFTRILEALLQSSADGRVLFVCEENGHVTSPDLAPEEIESIDILGPMSVEDFWHRHDLGEIAEDSVTVLDADM